MTELSSNEQQYLQAASNAAPQDWFLPRTLGSRLSFSDDQSDQIVESLASAGFLVAQPGSHARLTPAGRSEAARLSSIEKRGYPVRGVAKNPRLVAIVWLSVFVVAMLALLWLGGSL